MLRLVEVKWDGSFTLMDCPECGGETHYATLQPFIKCSHCEAVFEMPDQVTLSSTARTKRPNIKIAEGC